MPYNYQLLLFPPFKITEASQNEVQRFFLSMFFLYFSGPDYKKDYLPKIYQHMAYVGEKRPALEKTGDLRYLWRPASNRSFPMKYRHEYAGEIGWGIPEHNFINKTRLETGFHIKVML